MIYTSASISVQYDNIFSPFKGRDWKDGFRWAKESGFDAVEIILSDPGLLDIEEIQKTLKEMDMKVSTISTGQAAGMEGIEMSSVCEASRAAARNRLFADVDFAEAVGGANVTIGLIRGKGGRQEESVERTLLIRELKCAADYAGDKGIRLNVEPINRYECSRINSTREAYELLRDMGFPENVGILFDTFHSNIEDPDILQAIRDYGKYFSHVHFADSNRRLPGEGHVPFREIVRVLREIGYEGYVSLEVLNRPDAAHVIENAGKAVKEILKKEERETW